MSRYRKPMSQAIQEGAIAVQILNLKKAYEPMRNKTISFDNAKKLQGIFDKFDSNKDMLKQLFKADIPFVSGMASARLISKHGLKAQQLMQIRKESVEQSLIELKQINEALTEGVGHISGFRDDKEKANVISLAKQHGLKVDSSGPKLKLSGNMKAILDIQLAVQKNGLKAEDFRVSLDEGRMSQISQMQDDGKSPEEIAKLMKLDVKVVKGILGEKIRIRPKNALGEEKDSEKKEKKPETTDTDVAKKDDEIALLKQKMETDKAKNVQKQTQKLINPETGEPLLQVGIAYKHIKDKEKAAKEKDGAEPMKESSDYLKSKLDSSQIANIKATWGKKKASDVTPGVKAMLKNMDIPTQLAIKQADIPHLSKLIESAFRLSYDDKYGKHAGFEDAKTLQDLQHKAAKLRAKGFKINKMGRNTSPVKVGDMFMKKFAVKENIEVTVTKKGSGPANKRSSVHDFDNPAAAKKWIKWYKTGNMKDVESIKMFDIAKSMKYEQALCEFTSQQIKQAYGILNDPRYKQGNYSGAVAAIEKLAKGLSKHPDVANALKRANEEVIKEARWQIEGTLSYKGIGSYDGFHMVIDSPTKPSIEKIQIELDKARKNKKIGPGGGGYVEDVEVTNIERTSDKLQAPNTFRNEETIKEGYEGSILAYLKKYSDKAYFSYRKLMVKKGSEGMVKTVLTRGVNDRSSLIYGYELPAIAGVNEENDKAYAIGMAKAKEKYNDEPPLEKKTIKKAHQIADKIIAKEQVHPSKETYERIRGK